jgi:ATP synthase assembly factor FMC1
MSHLQARTTYRALLREIPRRNFKTPSPLHQKLRHIFRSPSSSSSSSQTQPTHFSTPQTEEDSIRRVQEADQLAQYARAQRTYCELVERYNPGMTMDEEEKIRLTARRVGFDLPELHTEGKSE